MASLFEQTQALRAGTGQPGPKKILIYGPAKVGKTALAGSILKVPHITRVIWFDNEHGFETIQTFKDAAGNYMYNEELDKVELINQEDYPDEPIAIATTLETLAARTPKRICAAHGRINCSKCGPNAQHYDVLPRELTPTDALVFDSGTQIGISALKASMKVNSFKDKRLHYAEAGSQLNDLFTMIQSLNTNIVMVAHELIIEEEKQMVGPGGKVITKVNVTDILPSILSRGYAQTVGKNFGHVIHQSVSNHKFNTGSSPLYKDKVTAGSRSGINLADYSNPRLSLMFTPEEPDKPKNTGGAGGIKINLKT